MPPTTDTTTTRIRLLQHVPRASKRPTLSPSMHKNVYLHCMLPLLADCVKKWAYPKSTHSSSALLKSVQHHNIIENLVQIYTAWVPLNATKYLLFCSSTMHMRVLFITSLTIMSQGQFQSLRFKILWVKNLMRLVEIMYIDRTLYRLGSLRVKESWAQMCLIAGLFADRTASRHIRIF